MIRRMKKINKIEIANFPPQQFFQFQPSVTHKSVAYKNIV